jgi:predicted DNA binding CopG/RHH family protein
MSSIMKQIEEFARSQPEHFIEDDQEIKDMRREQIRQRWRFAYECTKRDIRFKKGL